MDLLIANYGFIVKSGILLCFCFCIRYEPVLGKVTILGQTPNQQVTDHENVPLVCGAGCSNGSCSAAWTHPGLGDWEIASGSLTGNPLSVSKLSRQPNIHTFICTVTDMGDNSKGTCEITLEVIYAPDVYLTRKENVLECIANGNPDNFTFGEWKHTLNGETVRYITGNRVNASTLELELNSTYEDSGRYECTVQNGVNALGELWQTKVMHVTQRVKPVVLTPTPIEHSVSKGEDFFTDLEVLSNYWETRMRILKRDSGKTREVTYFIWDRDMAPVNASFYGKTIEVNGTYLFVGTTTMEEEYFGEYEFAIENAVGSTTVKAYISPQGAPDAPIGFTVTDISHDSVKLHVTSGFFNGGNQTLVVQYRPDISDSDWILGGEAEVGSKRNQSAHIRVSGLDSATSYIFRAFSYNEYNMSGETGPLYIDTKTDPPVYALIGGGTGVVVIIVVIVIILIVVKRRKSGRKKIPIMLPDLRMNDILAANPDKDSIPSPYIYENSEMNANGQSDNELYENTQRSMSNNNGAAVQDENYANIPLVSTTVTSFQPNKSRLPMSISDDNAIYSNTNTMPCTASIAQPVFDGPDSMKDPSIAGDDKSYANVIVQSSAAADNDEDYLDMELTGKPSIKSVKHTSSFSSSKSGKGSKKSVKSKGSSKKKQMVEIEPSESSDLYIDMGGSERESMPDFPAPPPPVAHNPTVGEGYVNL